MDVGVEMGGLKADLLERQFHVAIVLIDISNMIS